MMKKGIDNANQLTPEWLTSILHTDGILPQGRVVRITTSEAQPAFGSSIWRLGLTYSNDAPPEPPKRLFLKCSTPLLLPGTFDPKKLENEFVFYQTIAPMMNAPFVIPIYDVFYEAEPGRSHLLMKDVSGDYGECLDPYCVHNCEKAVDVLAQLHAFWWDHPQLGKTIGRFPTTAEREHEIKEAVNATTVFINELGDQLPAAWRMIYEQVLSGLPKLFQRHTSGRNLTVVHGDAHLGNFLFPHNPELLQTYLIDWQFWHATIGGTDLAFMMATEWETKIRRNRERELVWRYYQKLVTLGVKNYHWEDCWNDYRLSIILVSIFIPVWRRVVFQWKVDLPTVDRCMTAFMDLHCEELL